MNATLEEIKVFGETADIIAMICPNRKCRKLLKAPVSNRGKLAKCVHCQTMFRIPDPSKIVAGQVG